MTISPRATACLVTAATLTAAAPASAGPVTFDLVPATNTFGGVPLSDLDDSSKMSLTKDGITAELKAFNDSPPEAGVSAVLNATSEAFGVQSFSTSPTDDDDLSRIDNDEGIESIQISFDIPVYFKKLTVSRADLDPSASGAFSFSNNAPTIPFTISDPATKEVYTNSVRLNPNQFATITHTDGEGFSLDSFTVQAVPTPSAGVLALLGLGGLGITRRRRLG